MHGMDTCNMSVVEALLRDLGLAVAADLLATPAILDLGVVPTEIVLVTAFVPVLMT